MKIIILFFSFLILDSENLFSQFNQDSVPEFVTTQRRVDERTSDFTYITATGGVGKSDTLWFEGKLVPWLYIYSGKCPFDVMLAPQIVLRMYRKYSSPVTSPSFMPRLRFDYFFRSERMLFTMIASHHSNGQADSFYNVGGSLNITTGNFSTNFFKFALYSYRLKQNPSDDNGGFESGFVLGAPLIEWIKWLEVEIPMFPGDPINREPSLDGLYSFYGVGTAIQTSMGTLRHGGLPFLQDVLNSVQFRTELEWRLPEGLKVKPSFRNQFDFNETILVGINDRNDLKLFLNYYYGEDYYNMRFGRTMNVGRIGLQFNLGNFRIEDESALRTD